MPNAAVEIDTQGGAVVTGNITTSGGDVIHRDKIIGGDDVRGNKYVTVLGAERPLLYVGVPPMPQHFLGREALVEDLVDRLCVGQTTALSADGLPGVGKTTLAVALARDLRLLAHFRDGILWAGLGRTPDVASIQATWADALGVDLRDLIDPYARTGRLTNAIGDRRLLLVLDDVWQWEAAAQLRCSAPQVVTILTTRDQTLARRFAGPQQSVNVPVLAPQPAYALLAVLAPEACATDPAAAQRLAALVDGLPLALELLGGYLGASSQRRTHARRQQALTTLTDPAARLALATERLGDAHYQAMTLQATIALSLADLPTATVAAFHALGAFAPKPARFTLPAALAVTGAEEESLFTLADRNLVEMGEDETLGLHQTLSAVARTQLPVEVTTRHRDYYLALVDEDREDWQRIEIIYEQISFAWAQLSKDTVAAVDFVNKVGIFQIRRGLWADRLNWLHLAYESAKLNADTPAKAHMMNNLGFAYSALGNNLQALKYYEQALPLWRQAGNKMGEATTLNNIGGAYDDLGDKSQALTYYLQALPLRRQVADKSGEASTLNNLGGTYSDLGDKLTAISYIEQALSLMQQVGNKAGEANIHNNLGVLYRSLGHAEQSLKCYESALHLLRQVGDKAGEANTLSNIGALYDSLGDKVKALVYYEEALPLRRQVIDKAGEATTLNNIGAVYRSLGNVVKALSYYEQALDLRRQVSDKAGEATTLNNMGSVYRGIGNMHEALIHYEKALLLQRQVGDKAGEATTLTNIGRIYRNLNNITLALTCYEQALLLSRQVKDRWQESITCYNMAMAYRILDDTAAAERWLLRTVELDEAIGHPDLAHDRALLEQVRQERWAG